MKKLLIILIFLLFVISLLSCNKKNNENKEPIIENKDFENKIENIVIIEPKSVTVSDLIENNYLTDYSWGIYDGRSREDQTISTYDWVGRMTPQVFFRSFEIPAESVLYQRQLRKEYFHLYYQIEGDDYIYQLENTLSNNTVYSVEMMFDDHFNILRFSRDGYIHSRQRRVGEQSDLNYPLVGIWGQLPNLTEYRIVDSKDCFYYLEIDREIPFWAVRKGCYLLKQTGDNYFETVSPIPEGRLILEVKGNDEIWLRPVFTLSDNEEGLVDLLVMWRNSITFKELKEDEELYNYLFGN